MKGIKVSEYSGGRGSDLFSPPTPQGIYTNEKPPIFSASTTNFSTVYSGHTGQNNDQDTRVPMAEDPPTFSEQVHSFTDETTFHGLGRIKPSRSRFRSVMWFIFFLGFLMYFIYIFYVSCYRYLLRDVTTKLTVTEADRLVFPTATFCSYNAISKKFAQQDFFTEHLVLAMSPLTRHQSRLNFSDPVILQKISELNMFEFYQNATPNKKELFIRCSWGGVEFQDCAAQFEEVLTPWGFCYSFNGPRTAKENGHYRNVSRTGSQHGLWVQISAEQYDYFLQQDGLSAAGYKMLLHDPDTVARVDELGFAISPGRETLVSLTEVRVSKLPPPYIGSNCTDTKDVTFNNPLRFYPVYSRDNCRVECETHFIYKTCNCTPYYLPASDYRNCSLMEYYVCAQGAKEEYKKNDTHEMSCDCPEACVNTYYSSSVSSAEYPSDLVVKTIIPMFNITEEYIRKNYLEIQLYHEALSFEKIEQIEAYSPADLQADIGGNLGLCIGGSFISCLEVFEFLFLLCFNAVKKLGRVSPNKSRRNADNIKHRP